VAEQRRVYRINSSNPDEINRVLSEIAERMDQLEGYRGQGDFKTVPISQQQADANTEVLRFDQYDLSDKLDKGGDGGLDFAASDITASTITLQGATPLTLEDTVWEDIRVPVTALRVGAAAAPSWAAFLGNTVTLEFSATLANSVHFSAQLPHNYKQGTDVEFHIHWSPSDTSAGNTRWVLEYTWANIGATFPSTTVMTPFYGAATTTTADHIYTDGGDLTGAGKTISSMIVGRLTRQANEALDTYNQVCHLHELDFHYQIDTLGSSTETAK